MYKALAQNARKGRKSGHEGGGKNLGKKGRDASLMSRSLSQYNAQNRILIHLPAE
jgi:hypothetical protein